MMDHPLPSDSMVLATAFRAAHDADVLSVMSIQSSRNKDELQQLQYYMVPSMWLRRAWPLLSGQIADSDNERERVGEIACRELLLPDEVNGGSAQASTSMNGIHINNNIIQADDDDDDSVGFKENPFLRELQLQVKPRKQRQQRDLSQKQQQKLRQEQFANAHSNSNNGRSSNKKKNGNQLLLRHDLQHETDFYLFGPNTWLLIKSKFGNDFEIARSCQFVKQSAGTSLTVVLEEEDQQQQQQQQVAIPPTGRFCYESVLTHPPPPVAHALDNNHNKEHHPGNVSDDETDELFPMINDNDTDPGSTSAAADDDDAMQYAETSEPVLLLPASTTITASREMNGGYNGFRQQDDSWGIPSNINDHNDSSAGCGVVLESRVVMRRYGSGLGNMGNTCFMNSTLQCLAHTDPLRKYFLSGEYEHDLNRDNPLGTGGDLATQFAQLLAEMWRTTTTHYGSNGSSNIYNSNDPRSTSHVVYPRSFKYTLGKHAEQFMGYDQHDSQELATYLLDALHEDTNRVTKKPYVEKPEQGEDESDEQAADKAWALHLKREDSRVLDFFMGQVKSRVKCCVEGCGRVSTTFDPFMFLSVPIPGSSERTIAVTFVPMNPNERLKNCIVVINKMATIRDLAKKVEALIKKHNLTGAGYSVPIEDMAICDIWKKDVHSWHSLDKEVEIIRDSDDTFVYELAPLAKIQEQEKAIVHERKATVDEASLGLPDVSSRPRRYELDQVEQRRIDAGDQWIPELEKYIRSPTMYYRPFHPSDGTLEERVKYYKRLIHFVDVCFKEVERVDTTGQKPERYGDNEEESTEAILVSPGEPARPEIQECMDLYQAFKNVDSLYDVVVLDYLSTKVRNKIVQMENVHQEIFPDGVTIEIRMRNRSLFASREHNISFPLALRITSCTTVFQLREILAQRLSRCIKRKDGGFARTLAGENTTENEVVQSSLPPRNGGFDEQRFGSPELLCLRQIPLSYQRGATMKSHIMGGRQLGSIRKLGGLDATKPISLASPTDEKEKMFVAELVGEKGIVILDWPEEPADCFFDAKEFEKEEDVDEADDPTKGRLGPKAMNVLDCIEKFVQMEQLEESEMWYCNRCKEHVRAWKQFHIYRGPPILIIHLKRFQYSARSHRRDKINLFIDFPLKGLDLTSHVLHWSEDEKPIYDCYAVSNHYGGLGGGHYTAYALNDDGEWCYYDDSRITTGVDPKEVASDAAYVLYYRRRDVPVGEEFVMNLQTPGMPAPALIQVDKGRDNEASEVSSSAAMVGDDMDVEDDQDLASRSTSPMGSAEGDDGMFVEAGYPGRDDNPADDMNLPPSQ